MPAQNGVPRRLTVLLPLLVLGLPVVGAGSAEDPELTDPAGDADPPAADLYADGLAAWIEPRESEVAFFIRVAQIDQPPPSVGYLVIFDANGSSYYAGAVGAPPTLDRAYVHGEWDRETDFPVEGGEEITGELATGSPATITLRVPIELLDGAASIDELSLRIFDYGGAFVAGADFMMLDVADGGRSLALATAADTTNPPTSGAQTPGIGPALAVLVAGVVALARRAHAR